MPAVFTGRWTRGTILDQALKRVGNVKIKHLARDRLNRILEELYSQWEWPFLYKVSTFNLPGGNTGGQLTLYASFALPDDFLKTENETTGLRITARDGNPASIPIVEMDPVRFRRRAIPHDLSSSRALIWYASYAERIGYFWPRPTETNTVTLIYKFLPADVAIGSGTDATTTAYDADIPLYPWGGHLSMEVEAWAHQYEESPRYEQARADANRAFDMIRNIAMPRASQDQTIPLDPTVFGPAFRPEAGRFFRADSDEEF
jgi:hypothetical protein